MTVGDVSGGTDDCTDSADWGADGATFDGYVTDEAQLEALEQGDSTLYANIPDADVPPFLGEDCSCGCPTADVQGETPVEFQGTDQCGDAATWPPTGRGQLQKEYQVDGETWVPHCGDFDSTSSAPSYFSGALSSDDIYSWYLDPGFEQDLVNTVGLGENITSAYRNPDAEKSIDETHGYPFYVNSAHAYGDGFDIAAPNSTVFGNIQNAAWDPAQDGGIACVEPFNPGNPHAHVDWRTDSRNFYVQAAVCPTNWGKP